jgi:hypothetical protein
MINKLKSLGGFAVGLLILAAVIFLIVIFIAGAGWVSAKLLPFFSIASLIAFAALLFVLVPLSAIRATRGFAAIAIMWVSFVFGVTAWMEGLLVSLDLWGVFAVIVGLCIAGVGVVPIGILAALFHGRWSTMFELIFLIIATFGSRAYAVWVAQKADEANVRATLIEQTIEDADHL